MELRTRLFALGLAAALIACGSDETKDTAASAPEPAPEPTPVAEVAPPAGAVTGARIAAADSEPHNWLAHGRTYGEQRFSPLDQIRKDNVSQLGLAWSFDTSSTRGLEGTPIVVDGVMYTSTTWNRVVALDARSGEKLWEFDPQVSRAWARNMCCDVISRGIAVWEGAVFAATLDGRLISIDAATGEKNWEVQTTDLAKPYSITGAPRVVKGKVIIGNGGAELGVRGYVTAYDTATGQQAWRFYIVPGDPSKPFEHPELEKAAATWSGEWWKDGGGGTAWDSMAYDPELDLLYVGTGNGGPWTRAERSPGGGDNLYVCSILALRPDTGELIWHYQTTPGDNWDYTSVQQMILADLEIQGEVRQVIMQAPKNGFFYVLDRATGELISAEPYVAMNWATHVDKETGRPVETPESNWDDQDRVIFPGPLGGHNWHPMSYHPPSGLVFVPAMDSPYWYTREGAYAHKDGHWNLGVDLVRNLERGEADAPEAAGHLLAWDPVKQEARWRVPHAGYWNGGVLSTAGGLVFQGTGDGRMVAYDTDTGDALWEVESTTGIMAAPISYELDGEQYVAVLAGLGGGLIVGGLLEEAAVTRYENTGRVLAFKLGAALPLPRSKPRDRTLPVPPRLAASADALAVGKSVYAKHCGVCHGPGVASSFVVPDLKYLSPEKHAAFQQIVLDGALLGKGMPRFDDLIAPEDIPALQGYIVSEAHRAYAEQNQPKD